MTNTVLVVWSTSTTISALLGTIAYFQMQRKLEDLLDFRPRLLKYPKDLLAVYTRYRVLATEHQLSLWPARIFLLSIIELVAATLFVLIWSRPFD
jgi:hypothetical protein